MTESADEIETRRAERDDLRADRDKLRGSLWGAYQMVCGAITDTYTYQSALPDAEAHEVDERLVPVRRAIGWDPYRNRACPAEAWAPMAQPSLEAVLGRHYEDNADKETLEVEVEELREAVKQRIHTGAGGAVTHRRLDAIGCPGGDAVSREGNR